MRTDIRSSVLIISEMVSHGVEIENVSFDTFRVLFNDSFILINSINIG